MKIVLLASAACAFAEAGCGCSDGGGGEGDADAAGWTLVTPAVPSYSDVPASHPLYGPIETGRENRLFEDETTGGTFRPDDPVTRAEAALFSYNVIRTRYALW